MPRLLAMLSVVAVFVPSFFMTGVSRSLFVPLSLAVGFSMIASFFLSSSLVPVLSVWLLGTHGARASGARHARGGLGRPAARSPRRLAAAARAGALASRDGLRGRDHRRRHHRRSDARTRDLSRRAASASSSCGSAPRPGPSSSQPSAWRPTCSTRSTRPPGPNNVDITLGLRRRPALVVSDQHDLSVDRRIARRRAAGRAQARGAASG